MQALLTGFCNAISIYSPFGLGAVIGLRFLAHGRSIGSELKAIVLMSIGFGMAVGWIYTQTNLSVQEPKIELFISVIGLSALALLGYSIFSLFLGAFRLAVTK